ncbi:MAG: radical SAM protein [Magnetococcales bacterium]|nr:radical SAM protein [Magnetococcales bacterium]
MRIMLMTLPSEGEPRDYTTPAHYSVGKLRYIPLGILAVASGIDRKHEVRIFDSASFNLGIDEAIKEIRDWQPDVLGMNASIGTAYSMSRILAEIQGPLKVVGGPHTTNFAEQIISLGATAVFIHDADFIFNKWLDDGCQPGIYSGYVEELDTLPLPALDLLNLEDYSIKSDQSGKVLLKNQGLRFPMYSSKGCPFRCTFCDTQQRSFRYKSPKRVVDEMEIYLDHGAETVHMMDDCFNLKRSQVLEICAEIQRRNLKFTWSARGRAKIDLKTAKALKESGCVRLHVGVETLDRDLLKSINKSTNMELMQNFFDVCRQVGIQTLGYFVIGLPGETREYRKKLPELIRKAGIDIPFFNILFPLPHSDLYDDFVASGVYKSDFWKEYALNPTPDFQPPPYADEELHQELLDTAEWYVQEFFNEKN